MTNFIVTYYKISLFFVNKLYIFSVNVIDLFGEKRSINILS